jgi:hypothetical protein
LVSGNGTAESGTTEKLMWGLHDAVGTMHNHERFTQSDTSVFLRGIRRDATDQRRHEGRLIAAVDESKGEQNVHMRDDELQSYAGAMRQTFEYSLNSSASTFRGSVDAIGGWHRSANRY